MAISENILQLITLHASEQYGKALLGALPTADSQEEEIILKDILEKNDSVGLEGVVGQFHELSQKSQKFLVGQIDHLSTVFDRVSRSRSMTARLNMIELITQSGRVEMVRYIERQLEVNDSRVSRAASTCLLSITRMVCDSSNKRMDDRTRWLGELGRIIELACNHYAEYRRRDVLLALLCLVRTGQYCLPTHLTQSNSPIFAPLAQLIYQQDNPLVARAMLDMLAEQSLAPSVVKALNRPVAGKRLRAMFDRGFLLTLPAIRKGIKTVAGHGALLPTTATILEMNAQRLRWLPTWISLLDINEHDRVAGLRRISSVDDPLTRLRCLRVLMDRSSEEADEIIAAFCFDPEEDLARMASRWLIGRQGKGLTRLLSRLVNSPHGSVRFLAEHHLAGFGFKNYWKRWNRLDAATRLAAGRGMIKIDRDFNKKLMICVKSPQASDRIKALQMIRCLGLENQFSESLIALAKENHPRVASAAVSALGYIDSCARAIEVLHHALASPNDRMKANAIESLEMLNALECVVEQLIDISASGGNRSRATAIKVMMQLPKGQTLSTLMKMLQDEQASHRISALWVVKEMAIFALVEKVAEMAKTDPVREIRSRAQKVLQELVVAQRRVQSTKRITKSAG